MKRLATFVFIAALCLAAAGCRSAQPAAPPSQAMVSAANAGESVTLAVGGTLTVALPANPSTGYSWVPTSTPEFLFQQGQPTFEASSTTTAVGAGGTEVIRFKAVAPGSGTLVMEYVRPWETTSTPVKKFEVKVDAK